jgi:hypothetical protein
MKVVHIVPRNSIFAGVIQRNSDASGHECLYYNTAPRFGMGLRDFVALFLGCRRRPEHLFVFHWIPHLAVLALSLLIRNFRYALGYWGDDFYSTFMSDAEFEAHCLAKSPLLDEKYYLHPRLRLRTRVLQTLRLRIGLRVVRRAAGIISLCPKHFRILRMLHYRLYGQALQTPHLRFCGYSHDGDAVATAYTHRGDVLSLTVLICHSAATATAHRQSLAILRKYQEKWGVKLHVRGFLSYSGGDEDARNRLERQLMADASFAETAYFERAFLPIDEVSERLKEVEIAVFSSLRDEGVSLLRQFVKIGGMVSFNRHSMNYDYFRGYCPAKLLSHEEFLAMDPATICLRRGKSTLDVPKMLTFGDLGALILKDEKLRIAN